MTEEKKQSKKLAIIRLRGHLHVDPDARHTMKLLNLNKVNNCVLVKDDKVHRGMLKKIKDYVTFGEADKETPELLEKRKKEIKKPNGKVKIIYALHPPKKGFRKKGIKKAYKVGGALGYRGDKIKDLIKKMV